MANNPAASLGNNQYTADLATRLALLVLHTENMPARFNEASVSINDDAGTTSVSSANVVLQRADESVVRAKVTLEPEHSYQIRAEISVTVDESDLNPRTVFTDGYNLTSGIGHSAPAIFATIDLPPVKLD